ncbi:toll-like receptor 1 isoform X1 [Polypterus senegalus]|uniref:toll-like receptor 1 isoform X1 n=2 Tax=Polypterus senegalus TaxID=55291 RepID=UPI001962729A|nr:toll-like receptor 1 isoform X1 [Polypterus senegalus]
MARVQLMRKKRRMHLAIWTFDILILTSEAARINYGNGAKYISRCRYPIQHRVDLSNKNLTRVPSSLPPDIQYLDLSHNNISMIENGDMIGLPKLCVLKLSHNGLMRISSSTFLNNTELQVLDLSYNALDIIPNLGSPTFISLDLSGNLYENYTLGSSFKKMTSLQFLALGSHKARFIKTSDFLPLGHGNLKHLYLGDGIDLVQYENGSIAQLVNLKEITLVMSFCEKFHFFGAILRDLDETGCQQINLVKFIPKQCNVSVDPFVELKNKRTSVNLLFADTWFSSSVMTKLIWNVAQSPLQMLNLSNITFSQDSSDGVQFHGVPGFNQTSLRMVIIENVLHYQYNYPNFNISVSFFYNIVYMKFSGTGMNIFPCDLISSLPALEVLDLSNNLLNEDGFWWSLCTFTHVFPSLKQLYLNNNRFINLASISKNAHVIKGLQVLDLASNSLALQGKCSWPSHLTNLSLSNNNLGNSVFSCLSPYLKSLNLSKMGITYITYEVLAQLPNITHLYLSSNNINSLPGDLRAPYLQVLHVDQNIISVISMYVLQGIPNLEQFNAGNNPFSCKCESFWFVKYFNKTLLLDWPQSYKCGFPTEMAGKLLEEYRPSEVTCEIWIQVLIAVPLTCIFAVAIGISFHMLDGIWYLKMLWVWMAVKRRSGETEKKLGSASFLYHAFISYSHHDLPWVESYLVPNLEEAGFKLCIHQRDFVPGDWIIDNIINCVENSYKTLFILSKNFVQSEWCNYELFFAQHRALSIQQDSLVFILLEPIPANSLPRKFLKLRSLLQKQTYLEWPGEGMKQQLFWASLKRMLQAGSSYMFLKNTALQMADSALEMADSCSLITVK